MKQIPSVLTGDYANLWKELAAKAGPDDQCQVAEKDKFTMVRELADLGGVEIVADLPEGLTVKMLYEPEPVPDSPAVAAAAKPTKFAEVRS